MSKTEILEELPKLTSEERHEIRLKLAELDGDGWVDDDDPLTEEQKALIERSSREEPWDFHTLRRGQGPVKPETG